MPAARANIRDLVLARAVHGPMSRRTGPVTETSPALKATPILGATESTLAKDEFPAVCDGLGQGSPRSVGSALRKNPFAPYVPCHRVISSDLYLGGYCGEWGPQSKTGTQYNRKLQFLRDEGVVFDEKGKLQSKEKLM
ncbi:hypothetical protein RSAG8_11649, partial [Rhizoctonia solani AG-8 WAC10335]